METNINLQICLLLRKTNLKLKWIHKYSFSLNFISNRQTYSFIQEFDLLKHWKFKKNVVELKPTLCGL
jgi:hypothetical protein